MAIDCISTSPVRFGQDFADEIQTLIPSVSNHIAIICASIASGYLNSAERLVCNQLAIDGTISQHHGARALNLAERKNASDLVRLFIYAGLCPFLPLGTTADPQLRNLDSRHELHTGESAFRASVKHGRNGMVELFLHNQRHEDPVENFIQQNEAYRVKKLLDLGADANARAIDEQGATALQFAAPNGNFDIVNMLLTAVADVNATPAAYDGRTAIEGAAEWGRLDMVRYLLDNGADVRGPDSPSYRRSIYRAWTEGHRTVVRMIQEWKTERYGQDSCEDPERILSTMSIAELDFADHAARNLYRSGYKRLGPLYDRRRRFDEDSTLR